MATRLVDPGSQVADGKESRATRLVREGQSIQCGPRPVEEIGRQGSIGEDEPVVVKGRAAREPVRLRIGADEREQARARPACSVRSAPRCALTSASRDPRDRRSGSRARMSTRGWTLQPIDEIVRHAGAEICTSDHHCHRASLFGQEHRGLSGRISSTDHDHRVAATHPRLEIGRGVVDALRLELVNTLDRETPVVGTGRGDDCSTRHLRVVRKLDDEMARSLAACRRPGMAWSTVHRTSRPG